MDYYEVLAHYKNLDLDGYFSSASARDVERAIAEENFSAERLIALLSPAAEEYLETMAQAAHSITLKYFGRTIQLYTPIYISNYCDNSCVYCGFSAGNKIDRMKLSMENIREEAEAIASTGLKHVLVLTGESRSMSPLTYIRECVSLLRDYFSSISVEIYPLSEEEYRQLIRGGADGLTIYQETYDERLYAAMHPSGPKSDYLFRLCAPERGARAGMRGVNIGALLGLGEWRKEVFFAAMHAKYLQDNFPDVEIGVSIPRLRPHAGNFTARHEVSDADIVQIITAFRIFLPRAGITVSTREDAGFRENVIPLGVTRISAGSTTMVGGRTFNKARSARESGQFEISDHRSVEEIKAMLERRGYQAVLKDWMPV
jgi:2-iminoacetate synthase